MATQSTNFETQIQQNTDVNQIENYLKLILDKQDNVWRFCYGTFVRRRLKWRLTVDCSIHDYILFIL